MSNKPKVSILCITYNHGKFIRDALDGFVMQKTNFPFEVLIHDDASTDGTADIIREYEQKYPDIIKPIYQKENQWSRGVKIGPKFQWPHIRGKYVAVNEGDDYWTDPNKLQKQVDFLDAHPDFNVCFHPVQVIWDEKRAPDYIYPTKKQRFNKDVLNLADLLKCNFIQTNSVMYRWHDMSNEWPKQSFLPGDWMMHLLQTGNGKIGFIPDIMSVYRRNAGGIWTGAMESDDWFSKCTIPHLHFYQEVENKFNVDKSGDKSYLLSKALKVFLRTKNWDKITTLVDEFPDVVDNCVGNYYMDYKNNSEKRKYKHQRNRLLALAIIELAVVIGLLIGGII